MNSRFESLAVAGAWGAHVTPQAGVEMLGRYWTTTSRESVKTRSIIRRPVGSVGRVDLSPDGAERVSMGAGRARVFDPLNPSSAIADPFAASVIAPVVGRIAIGHVDEVAGYGSMIRDIPTPWSLRGRVLLSIDIDESLVADEQGIRNATGFWASDHPLPPVARRARISPIRLDASAHDEAHSLALDAWTTEASELNCTVGLTTPVGPIAVPARWDPDHGSAIVRRDVLSRLSPSIRTGACVTLDRHAERRADEKVGLILRGLPSLRRLPRSNELADDHVGVVIAAERVTWWYGFTSGSNATDRRAAA